MIGVSLASDATVRWLESSPRSVEYIEVAGEAFFARRSPLLAWLGRHYPIVLRLPALSIGSPGQLAESALSAAAALASCCSPQVVVHPLAARTLGDVQLRQPIPASRLWVTPGEVAAKIAAAQASIGGKPLIEPTWAHLRLPGSATAPDYLAEVCATAGCRLLLDLAGLAIARTTSGLDSREYLASLPAGLIGGLRIGGGSGARRGWPRDSDSEWVTWDLLDDVLERTSPEVLLLDHPGDDIHGLEGELARLRQAATGAAGEPAASRRAPGPTRRHHDAGNAVAAVAGHHDVRAEDPPAPAVAPARAAAPPSRAINPAVALFVLDREGVFFSAEHRELTLFNTAATFVWCLLEDGESPEAIASAYADTFDVDATAATRHVGTVLRHWYGRGYIDSPGPLRGEPTPFPTALSWLLTNRRIREQFKQAPADLADLLDLRTADRPAFVSLDRNELDAQAAAETQAALSEASSTAIAIADDASDALQGSRERPPAASGLVEHRYRLLGTTMAVRTASRKIASALDEALGHLSTSAAASDVDVEIRDSAGGWAVLANGSSFAHVPHSEGVVPIVKQLLREHAVDRHPHVVSVHAGVVAFGDHCVLLPAVAGSGKTTLTAALIAAGGTYFSDEIALLDAATLRVTPVPLPLTIKDGSLDPLRSLYPELDRLVPHVREDHVRVRYMPPRVEHLPAAHASALARWIVFPRYSPGSDTALQPLDRPSALRRLLEESYLPPASLDRGHVESIVRWMRNTECYELPFSSLSAAVELVRRLPSDTDTSTHQPES